MKFTQENPSLFRRIGRALNGRRDTLFYSGLAAATISKPLFGLGISPTTAFCLATGRELLRSTVSHLRVEKLPFESPLYLEEEKKADASIFSFAFAAAATTVSFVPPEYPLCILAALSQVAAFAWIKKRCSVTFKEAANIWGKALFDAPRKRTNRPTAEKSTQNASKTPAFTYSRFN